MLNFHDTFNNKTITIFFFELEFYIKVKVYYQIYDLVKILLSQISKRGFYVTKEYDKNA